MTWRQHIEMLIASALLVTLSIAMIVSFVFASAALSQWRVDQNMARFEMAERVNQNDR